ncbi:hypothetical protein M413DRAFT_440048 [Hebeloma cylindrosporum]|uniref:C2 domain-containing protein n=1 Tax=Hebeloma cylindrosporum TaxID=76867 RepID=A0A0C2Z549_HEBCY|nr:hypothetical protein M413DRAFT_440048 [Hebeloma cylindrosporum h7]
MKCCGSRLFKCLGGNSGSNVYEPLPSNVAPPTVIGMARVVIQSATVNKRFRIPRPYVDIQLQGSTIARTNIPEEKTHSPNWFSESLFVLIYSLQENLEFVVSNYHRGMRHGVIGRATFPLFVLAGDSIRTGEERPILKNTNEVNGTLLFDVFYYPIIHSHMIKDPRSTSRTPSFF